MMLGKTASLKALNIGNVLANIVEAKRKAIMQAVGGVIGGGGCSLAICTSTSDSEANGPTPQIGQ